MDAPEAHQEARSEAQGSYGLDVDLIGAGNSAGQAALHVANHARTVTLVVRLGPVKRVAAAVGEGSMAIAFIHEFLRRDA